MEEINLKDLFNYFINKLFIIIICFVLLIVGSGVYSMFLKTPMYNSYTTIVLTRTEDTKSSDGITQNDITLNQKLVATYREIIKSRRVLGQVIDNLKLDINYEELAKQVSVTNQQDTELLKISVKSDDKELAASIADEIAKVFSNEIVNIYNIKNVSIIDKAIVSDKAYNMNLIKESIIAGLAGIVVGCGIVFVMFYFDTTIKNTDVITDKLGLPLLGIVPNVDNKKKSKKKKGAN